MVTKLDVKVVRDLRSASTQILSIALLIGSGIAILIMSASNYMALIAAMDSHYRAERFADLFAGVKRAPTSLLQRVLEIDGVGVAEARIVQPVRVSWPNATLPIMGRIVSVPATRQPHLNRLHLTEGRWVDPNRRNEIIINAAFAEARKLRPGETIDLILNGRLQSFDIVGVALSPEFVFATRSALPLPDDRNFVVVWAGRDAVASAFDMTGAFNDLIVSTAPGASRAAVIAAIDRLLAPYGGIGAYGRSELPSHRFLEDELAEQEVMSLMMPAVFFGIAAFLLNIVLGRMISAQREQIASLKALGFSNVPIALHYFKFVAMVALLGGAIGLALGAWLARIVIESYRVFFRFPVLEAQLDPRIMLLAVLVSLAAACAAAWRSVIRIARMPPAEAMRPASLDSRQLMIGATWRGRRSVSPRALIVFRGLLARPGRTLLTIIGIALSVPMVLFGLFWFDAIQHMVTVSFDRIERGDAVVALSGPVPSRAVRELAAVSGVRLAEGQRIVPVRLRAGHRSYRVAINGLASGSELKVPRQRDLSAISIPESGLVMTAALAERLGLEVGDPVTLEVLEGDRAVREARVARLSDDFVGFSVTMDLHALNRMLGEGDVVNAIALRVDAEAAPEVWRRLQEFPRIEASSVKAQWIVLFNDTIAGILRVGAVILSVFGILIAAGVVYNSARVSLHERAWELASLRILGFTKAEASRLLLAELGVSLAVAIPLGLLVGQGLIHLIVTARARESFQVPAVIAPSSYGAAALVVLLAGLASALVVRRRVEQLDLVSVLKTRD